MKAFRNPARMRGLTLVQPSTGVRAVVGQASMQRRVSYS